MSFNHQFIHWGLVVCDSFLTQFLDSIRATFRTYFVILDYRLLFSPLLYDGPFPIFKPLANAFPCLSFDSFDTSFWNQLGRYLKEDLNFY